MISARSSFAAGAISIDLLEVASIHRHKQYGITRSPTARFLSLERFGRRPEHLKFGMGRHPKSFTEAKDVWISSKRSEIP